MTEEQEGQNAILYVVVFIVAAIVIYNWIF